MGNKESGTIYFIAGLLLGGIVGAGVGLIVAPEAGEKTIARIKKEGGKLVKRSLDAVDDFEKEQIEPTVERVTKQIKSKVAEVRHDVKAAF